MDSASILMPSAITPTMGFPLTNGHLSPLAANVTNADEISSPSSAEESEMPDAAAEDVSSEDERSEPAYNESEDDNDSSEDSEDMDADGEPDGDYDSETPPPVDTPDRRARTSSSEESTRPAKRKAGLDDDISQNPELYGLRRSARPRPTRRIVDSSDEGDSFSDQPRKRQRTISRKASRQPPSAIESAESESGSEDYVTSRKHALTKKERRRRMQIAAGTLPPSRGEVRFSSRRTKAVANYNEDDDEDMFDDDDDEATTPYDRDAVPEDTGPAIDKILDHRPAEGADVDSDPLHAERNDFEYLIKWQDRAHYHSTWEPFETVRHYRGYRKIDNYFKNVVLHQMHIISRRRAEPEEYEQYMVSREAERESQRDFHQVERVIGTRDGDEGTEYYVKWKGLNYDLCTWESDSLVSSLSQQEIDRYLDRSSKLPISDKKESNLATRRKFIALKEQPDYIKYGQLRSFQIHGVNFLAHNWCKGKNVILADEMGLGKTVQTVAFMNWLRHDRKQNGPFICVVPLSTMPAWADTFNNWTPDINYVIYTGSAEARRVIRECELLVDGNVNKVKFNVLVTTYEYVLMDAPFLSQLKWQFLAVDEAHRLKNRESQLYEKLKLFNAPSRLLITGTPIQNTLGELSALMDFLMPGEIQVDENVDLASEDASRQLAELSKAIQPYMIRRTKEKVENDLPPKSEKILRVELSDFQLEYYKNILTRNYEALNEGGNGQKQSLLNIVMELKKASNHPLLFPNAEAKILKGSTSKEDSLRALITTSGKMMLLDRLLAKLKADGHRVLIFSQMVHMLDILTDYLRLRNYQFQRLDGTVPASDRKIAIDHFNAPDSEDYCFLLSTRAGGLGINLMTADTVVLFDSDWNPQADLQAMARAHRIGQKNPVSVYRLVSKDTIEEEILERARNKRMLEFITIQRGITDREQQAIADKMNRAAGEPNSADDINQILKRRGQKMFEQSGNQKKLEELDIDAVLENAEEHKTEQAGGLTSDGGEEFLKNFEYTDVKIDLEWDDIIPKDELDVVKAEIQQRKVVEETQRLIAENAPRNAKRKAATTANEREQRAAKKRAREAARQAAADVSDSGDESSSDTDPKRPLSTKEIRNLIRAYERYGSFDDRRDDIIRDSKLTGRDPELLKATLDEVVSFSQKMLKEEQARLQALEKDSKKVITKKDKKAVLFDFKNVKRVNAETIMERPVEMRVLKEATDAVSDWRNFRVPDAIKPANYSCEWGAREDGMLCIGIARHGYGAWVSIRDDPDLDMGNKLFLEEHRVDKKEERSKGEDKNAKSPGAVHLVRRANYLLTVLKEKTGANPNVKRLIENHHRNNKKLHLSQRRSEKQSSMSASSAGNIARKVSRDSERPHMRPHSNSESRSESRQLDHGSMDHRHRHSDHHRRDHVRHDGRPSTDRHHSHSGDRINTPDSRRRITGDRDRSRPRDSEERHRTHHRHPSMDTRSIQAATEPRDEFAERKLRGVRDNLDRLKKATSKNFPVKENLVKVLKTELIAIGNFIRAATRDQSENESRLWDHVCGRYWPKKTETHKIVNMYDNLVSQNGRA